MSPAVSPSTDADPARAGAPTHVGDATPSLLDAAIEQGGLHPFFHPKVSMRDGRLVGAEALARIATTQSPHASPMAFVQLAERNDRIDALTLAMTRAVARHARDFHFSGSPLPVSINISPVSLVRESFADLMQAAILGAGLACAQFTLEITQSRLVAYAPGAFDVLARLRTSGFGLSVDDFGTGYSNLDSLQAYPFTELKLDPSFTRKAMEEDFARACLESSIGFAKELGLRTVAEGVETSEMWTFLQERGVDDAQGFLMSRPLPPAELRDLLAGRRTLGGPSAR